MADAFCLHEGCNCVVEEGNQYCSDFCREHAGPPMEKCDCGHPGCQ